MKFCSYLTCYRWSILTLNGQSSKVFYHCPTASAQFCNFLQFSLFCGLYYKCFMHVIYNHNDSGHYYKTTITIVIDNHNR
jgi:hypothetical protein